MIFERKGNLEETLQSWSKPASDSEEAKCENAMRMIKDALRRSSPLKDRDIQLIPKGSYHNNTNVRLSSDVDIAVKLKDTFFANYPEQKDQSDFGNTSSEYTFTEYRAEVEQAMVDHFGRENIEFGNKAIQINFNTYRVDADVVPCFEHRRYSQNGTYITGTTFITKNSYEKVTNFPEQHYTNGVRKNTLTSKRYKKLVRIFKRLRYNMLDDGHEVEKISSFLIECLIWNVPNSKFNNYSLTEDVRQCFDFLILSTSNPKNTKEWGEVSELLYLFHPTRKYTNDDVHQFLLQARLYLFS